MAVHEHDSNSGERLTHSLAAVIREAATPPGQATLSTAASVIAAVDVSPAPAHLIDAPGMVTASIARGTGPDEEPLDVVAAPVFSSDLPVGDEPAPDQVSDLLMDFDPARYLNPIDDVGRASTASEIPMAAASTPEPAVEPDNADPGYEPSGLPPLGQDRDSRAVLDMLHELSALRDQ